MEPIVKNNVYVFLHLTVSVSSTFVSFSHSWRNGGPPLLCNIACHSVLSCPLAHRHKGVNQRVGGRRTRHSFITVVFGC